MFKFKDFCREFFFFPRQTNGKRGNFIKYENPQRSINDNSLLVYINFNYHNWL